MSKDRYSSTSRWAGLIGNILEHHDKALFVFLAPFIAPQFYPNEDAVSGLIKIYGVIVISLFMRPFGAWFLGVYGDAIGRKKALMISLFGMSLMTIGIGVLPSYQTIGSWAPLLLLLLRCGQNFFAASEPSNGAIYVLEHTKPQSKGFFGSIFEATTMFGILLGSFETALLAQFGLLEKYWQLLFLFAGGVGILGLFFRKYALESPEIKWTEKPNYINWQLLGEARWNILLISLTTGFSYATYIMSITFVNALLKVISTIDTVEMTRLNTLLSILDFVTLPLFGYLTYYYSPKRILLFATLCTAFFAIPLFAWMFDEKTLFAITTTRICIVLLGVCFAAAYPAWKQDLVIAKHRCTVLNMGSSLGQLAVEGPLTFVSLMMLKEGWELIPAVLLSLLGLSSFLIIANRGEGKVTEAV